MAQRRMFSLQIVDTDAFLDMPVSSQALYFHLSMRADDDGFVANPGKIMRMVGVQEDDLKVLIAKRFILTFESGVLVIKHWKIHNYIQADRYKETAYIEEKKRLKLKENNSYTERSQSGYKADTQVRVRLGKVRDRLELGKDRLNGEQSSRELSPEEKVIDLFYKTINPTINWGNKTSRKAAAELVRQFGLEETLKMAEQIIAVQGKKYVPTCTTPYQMKEKLAEFKIYFDKEKIGGIIEIK